MGCTRRASWWAESSGSTIPAAAASPTARCSAASRGKRRQGGGAGLKSSVLGLDAALAHLDAVRDQLAVALDARVGPDRLAFLEGRAVAGVEADDRRAAGHRDLLLAVLVLQRDLVAAGGCHRGLQVGVRHL